MRGIISTVQGWQWQIRSRDYWRDGNFRVHFRSVGRIFSHRERIYNRMGNIRESISRRNYCSRESISGRNSCRENMCSRRWSNARTLG